MKKNYILALLISLMALLLVACSKDDVVSTASVEGSGEKITLKLATFYGDESQAMPTYLDPWMKRVEELTEGQLTFDFYPSEQLGKAADLLKLTRDGVTDLSVIANSYTASQMPLTAMLQGLPRLADNQEQATKAFYDLLQENEDVLNIDYKNNGVLPLSSFVTPSYDLWTVDKVIKTPADLKGVKVRTPSGVANEFYESIDVVPISISTTEAYEALEKGVFNVAAYFAEGTMSSGTHELYTHTTPTNTGSVFFTTIINEKKWSSLPENIQEAIRQADKEISETVGRDFSNAEQEIKDNFVKNGGEIVELTDTEKAQWDKVAEEFTQAWLAKQDGKLPYESVLEHYKQLVEKYK